MKQRKTMGAMAQRKNDRRMVKKKMKQKMKRNKTKMKTQKNRFFVFWMSNAEKVGDNDASKNDRRW